MKMKGRERVELCFDMLMSLDAPRVEPAGEAESPYLFAQFNS